MARNTQWSSSAASPPARGYGRPPSRSQRSPRRPKLLHTVLLWSVVSTAALAVASASFLFIAAPADLVRDQIVHRVQERTGRDLTIAGKTALTFFPSMGLRLQEVTLSSPPGMSAGPMARAAEMDVQVPLWPLLRGQLEVGQVVLRRPELNLHVDGEGRRNWSFRRPEGKQTSIARTAGGGVGSNAGKLDARRSVALSDVHVEDGTIRFVDERRGREVEVTGLNLEIGLDSLDASLEARGNFTLRGQMVDVTGQLDSLAVLLAGSPAQLALRLSGQLGEATYEGSLATADAPTLSGTLSVDSGSLGRLASWLGSTLLEDAEEPLTLKGKLETTSNSISLTDTNARVGNTSVSGFAVLETRRNTRPRLSTELKLSALDLTKWLSTDGIASSETGSARPADASRGRSRHPDNGQPQVRGFLARHGWSDVPFNTARLDLVDADVRLSVDRLTYREFETDSARITVTLADRVLHATIDEMRLYGGSGRGAMRMDVSAETPMLEANLQLEDVAGLQLLQDATGFDWIDGRGRVALAITGQGHSELEVVSTLDGEAEFVFHDGALVGFDIPKMINGLHQGRIPRLERNKAERTSFKRLSASFTINDGIAENRDLRLESSLMQVTGAGVASLPSRTINYVAKPKLLAAASAQRSGQTSPGFELPIRITGSWDRPDFEANFDDVLKNPGEVIEAAKEVGKRIRGKDLKEALRNFLNDDDVEPGSTKQKARDLLRQFIKP